MTSPLISHLEELVIRGREHFTLIYEAEISHCATEDHRKSMTSVKNYSRHNMCHTSLRVLYALFRVILTAELKGRYPHHPHFTYE